MEIKTNLRALRHRYGLSLAELEAASGLSNQYLSRAELGQLSATERLEKQLASAIESVISDRKAELQALEKDYMAFKGLLLREEAYPNEQ